MMMSSGFSPAGPMHMLGCLLVALGILFFIFWAYKALSPAKLKQWSIWFVVIGILICVSAFSMMAGIGGKHMSMSGMTRMLEGKSGDDFDSAFIQMMIPHHEGAVDMAKMAATQAKHQEIKTLARNIIAAQEREIAQMKGWMTAWGYESDDDDMGMGMMKN